MAPGLGGAPGAAAPVPVELESRSPRGTATIRHRDTEGGTAWVSGGGKERVIRGYVAFRLEQWCSTFFDPRTVFIGVDQGRNQLIFSEGGEMM